MNDITRDIANTLREGAAADIWFDADRFDDAAKVRQIEATQDAMHDAATLLEAMPQVLSLLKEMRDAIKCGEADFSPSGDWFTEASAALAKVEG